MDLLFASEHFFEELAEPFMNVPAFPHRPAFHLAALLVMPLAYVEYGPAGAIYLIQ